MSRRLLALFIIVLFSLGCKGKLPKSLTSTKRNNSSNVTSKDPLELGKQVHEFSGELIFGSEPLEGLRKNDLVVVTWNTVGSAKVPEFFHHYNLFPKVRYIQYVSESDAQVVLSQIKALKAEGRETDGLSVLRVQGKTSQHLGRCYYDPNFKVVQNGLLVAEASSGNLDNTISKVIAGKFDTAKQAASYTNFLLESRIAVRSWYRMVEPLDRGKISFAEFTIEYLKWLDGQGKKWNFGDYYLRWAECRRLPEVSKAVTKLDKLNMSQGLMIIDIERHLSHPDCRTRVLNEFEIALNDKSSRLYAGSCRQMAEIAIQLNKKDLAKELLNEMIRAPHLKPLRAKETRFYFQQEYDDLMWRATH